MVSDFGLAAPILLCIYKQGIVASHILFLSFFVVIYVSRHTSRLIFQPFDFWLPPPSALRYGSLFLLSYSHSVILTWYQTQLQFALRQFLLPVITSAHPCGKCTLLVSKKQRRLCSRCELRTYCVRCMLPSYLTSHTLPSRLIVSARTGTYTGIFVSSRFRIQPTS